MVSTLSSVPDIGEAYQLGAGHQLPSNSCCPHRPSSGTSQSVCLPVLQASLYGLGPLPSYWLHHAVAQGDLKVRCPAPCFKQRKHLSQHVLGRLQHACAEVNTAGTTAMHVC